MRHGGDMFGFLKKKKKKEEVKETDQQVLETRPQKAENGMYAGMYCPVCGYMEVNPDSNALPLEGFALCSNCGAPLKRGLFMRDAEGRFSLVEHAEKIVERKKQRVTGGHYRVRPKGPYRVLFHGHFTSL